MTFLSKIELLDAAGWLCVFLAGLGLIFPFSVLAPANTIFIGLGLVYLGLFLSVEIKLLVDPLELKKLRQNFIATNKHMQIELQKFARHKSEKEYIQVENNGITFNACGRSEFIPWAEVILLQKVKTVTGNEFRLFTPTRKFDFDSTFQNVDDLENVINSAIQMHGKL